MYKYPLVVMDWEFGLQDFQPSAMFTMLSMIQLISQKISPRLAFFMAPKHHRFAVASCF
jgi:hypothetical protein